MIGMSSGGVEHGVATRISYRKNYLYSRLDYNRSCYFLGNNSVIVGIIFQNWLFGYRITVDNITRRKYSHAYRIIN